jgi:hypothetical protein
VRSIFAAREDIIIFYSELPMPAIVYGIITLGALLSLAVVTWSYRHVANRHSHKVDSHSGHH